MNKRNNHGLTMIGLILIILIILVFVVVGVIIGVSALKEKEVQKEFLNTINTQKVNNIEASAKEEVMIICTSMRLAIAQAIAQNREFSARDNALKIQKSMLNELQKETYLSKQGWVIDDYATNGDSTFTLVYQGEDYKKATNNSNAKIVFTLQVGISSIEVK